MLRSIVKDDANEFEIIREKEHVAKVYEAILKRFDQYHESWLAKSDTSLSLGELSQKFRVKASKRDDKTVLGTICDNALAECKKNKSKYEELFDRDALQEYQDDDPSLFKTNLSKKCPIVHHCVYSRRPEMAEWQMRFKDASSQELLDIFVNLVTFGDEYLENCNLKKFSEYDDFKKFQFEPLEEDENYSVQGVVGMGIKSEVLYHLYPHVFPKRGRLDVYGLYFLSGMDGFGLQGDNSEFLMINDLYEVHTKNYKMDHNYWYPYSLFALYAMRLTRLISQKAASAGVSLDYDYRFAYVASFFKHVCESNRENMEVMLGGLQD